MLPNSNRPADRAKVTARAACLLWAVALLLLAACAGPGYYAQAISGQWKMMRAREDITALLGNDSTDPTLVRQLKTVEQIRAFAAARLDLPAGDSYTTFVPTGREAATWNVVAAPEFSLEPRRWCFIVAGCVPYRGYFAEDAAVAFAAKMSRRGYDVSVSPAVAYSTLGWFDDPLLDTMLRYSDAQLAGLLFHELAHRRLYVEGDTAFNESYASFVEETGVRLWIEQSGHPGQLEAWGERTRAEAQFGRLLREARRQLAELYASGGPEAGMRSRKAELFDGLEAAYARLVREDWGGRSYFAGWMDSGLNNAGLALMNSYHGGRCAFAGLYREAGEDMAGFNELARRQAGLPRDARRAWLERPCGDIAPDGDL